MADRIYAFTSLTQGLSPGGADTTVQAIQWDGTGWGYVDIEVELPTANDHTYQRETLFEVAPLDKILLPGGTTQLVGGATWDLSTFFQTLHKWVTTTDPPSFGILGEAVSDEFGDLSMAADAGGGEAHLSYNRTLAHYQPTGTTLTIIHSFDFTFQTALGDVVNWLPAGGAAQLEAHTGSINEYPGKVNLNNGFVYMFKHAGYLWSLWTRISYRHRNTLNQFASGSTIYVAGLVRTTPLASGTAFTEVTYASNSQLIRLFSSYYAADTVGDNVGLTSDGLVGNSTTGSINTAGTPPVYWPEEDAWLICLAKGSHYDGPVGGPHLGTDLDLIYLMDASGDLYTALTMDVGMVGMGTSAWGGAVYYHEPTQTVYAFYITGTNIYLQTGDAGTNSYLHIFRLDAYTAPSTFTWTKVASEAIAVSGAGGTRVAPSGTFAISGDDDYLFIHWTSTSPGRIYKMDLSTNAVTYDTLPTTPVNLAWRALSFTRIGPWIVSLGYKAWARITG